MNYLQTSASLDLMEVGGKIDWLGWGFVPNQIKLAVQNGFQQQDGNVMVSIFPISDEAMLREKLGDRADSEDELGYYRILPESEAVAERDRLKSINDAAAQVKKNTPTEEDIYRAQQLLLLTQISVKLGGEANV